MKNFKLIGILILAIFLRLNYDTFIPGYNYDELAMMSTAVQSFPFGILQTAASNDYHAPLYQLIAHFFTYLTPEWTYLRLFNLILSIINIYVFYKIGCLVKNKQTGYLSALILTVNHLEISTVSFIKFYCLAFLLVSINLYYFIKINKYNKGYNKIALTNILLILTSTYGFILIGLEYLYLLFIKKREINLYKSILISSTGLILYLPVLINQIKLNFTNIFSPHSAYVEFAPISFYNALNDYFAPLLNYCCNLASVVSFSVLLKFIESVQNKNIEIHYLIEFLIFSMTPVVIAVFFVIQGIKNNQYIKKINIISLGFLAAFILMTKLELTGCVPIYLYPFAIICLASIGTGIYELKNKKLSYTLFIIYLFVNLFITNCYPPDKRDFIGSKTYFGFEEFVRNNPNAKIVVTTGGRFLKKYYKNKTLFEFDSEKMRGNFGRDYIALIYGKEIGKKINKKNAHELITPLILNKYRNPDFEKYFVENVYNKITPGENIIFSFLSEEDAVFLEKYDEYVKILKTKPYYPHQTPATFEQGLSHDYLSIDTAVMALFMESYSYEYLIDLMEKYFKRVKFEQYTRLNNDRFVKNYEDFSNKYSTVWLGQHAEKSWIFVTYKKE